MLNLLPQNRKLKVEQDQLYGQISRASVIVIGCFMLVNALLLTSKTLLAVWRTPVETVALSTTAISETEQQALRQKINQLTSLSAEVAKIQASYQHPLPPVITLLQQLPPNITLTDLTIDYSKKTLAVNGLAKQREDLLSLAQLLTTQSQLGNVNFPLNDLTQKENIPFQFTATLTDS